MQENWFLELNKQNKRSKFVFRFIKKDLWVEHIALARCFVNGSRLNLTGQNSLKFQYQKLYNNFMI